LINKRLYNKANNPIKRETKPYKEAVKMTFVTAKDPTKRAAKHPTKRAVTTTTAKTTTLQQQQQTTQQQKHQTTQNLTTNQKITRSTTTINVRNSRRFGALIPAKQTTKRSNRIGHGKRCHAIRVW
jgi:hypothetical protein